MPLIHCPECKNEISDSALKCPKCGVQLRKPKRTFFGKLIKWSFIAFNVLMAIWLVGGMGSASDKIDAMSSNAEKAGAAIGTGIGATIVIVLWVLGDIILGLFVLFTRPKD